jgi:hypothetical protein
MKRSISLICVAMAAITIGWGCWAVYFQSEFMNAAKAEKKWGTLALNVNQFKAGDLSKRAPIAVPRTDNVRLNGTTCPGKRHWR